MQSTDKPTRPQLPPAPAAAARTARTRAARLQAAWTSAWSENGFLHRRWHDLRHAHDHGWVGAAIWVKATAALLTVGLGVLVLDTAADLASAALHALSAAPAPDTAATTGLLDTVTHPVRVFLTDQAAHLNVGPGALYAFWQATGLLALVAATFGNSGARITWTLWGGLSLAMIGAAAPAGGRPAAIGLAALLWALASIAALHGLSLRPIVHNHPPAAPVFQPQFAPELHLHATLPGPSAPADEGELLDDNVHPFQR